MFDNINMDVPALFASMCDLSLSEVTPTRKGDGGKLNHVPTVTLSGVV